VRCEGSHPTCKTCEVYHDDCRYDKAPPISQVIAMAKRLQEAEEVIAELRTRAETQSPEDIQLCPAPPSTLTYVAPRDSDSHSTLAVSSTPSAQTSTPNFSQEE
jgi:hypothetical protein